MVSPTPAAAPRFDELVNHPDDAVTAYAHLHTSETSMRDLADILFRQHWRQVVVGPCIEGAVFEVCFDSEPALRYNDGYLTVDLGRWHFHLCVGPHRGSASDELRRLRPVAKAALFERRGRGCAGGHSWGVRLWNGYGEQMTTVFLPNPRLGDDQQLLKTPDWSRLHLYYQLRQRFLGEAMPVDFEAAAAVPLPERV